jgi:hypothetical protein
MKVHVHSVNLIKNQIIQKFQSLEILKERVVRQRICFLNYLVKTFMFNGFKICSFRCKSHVWEIILPKNMFGRPLKLILGFFEIFLGF